MKSKIISRKHILAFTLTCSLALAVFVNWYYTKPDSLQNLEPEVTDNISLGDAQLVNGTSISENYFEVWTDTGNYTGGKRTEGSLFCRTDRGW